MINLENIKTGDIGFIYNRFNRKDKNTWISGIVRAFMNFQNWVLGKELIKHQHCGMFVYDSWGQLYFCESLSNGWKVTLASIKFANRNPEHLVVKRYYHLNTYIDPKEIIGWRSKYGYHGLLSQALRQITFNIIDLEAQKRGTKFTYCSQSCSYWINKLSGGKYCQYWHSTDTQDLYFDTTSKIIQL